MRIVFFIAFIIFAQFAFGQTWRDSLNYARSAYKKGEYKEALRYYESAQKNAPKEVDLSDEMAQSAYKAREFERAEKIYQQSAASKKNQAEKSKAYHNLGNSRMKKKDYQGAIESYKEALKNDPKNDKTRYNLSEAIRRLKEEEQKQDKNKNKQDKNQQNQDQQNQDKQNQNQQNSNPDKQNQGEKQNQGKNQEKNQQNNKNSQGKNSEKSNGLPNKAVNRLLDELTKAEALTKRKIGGNEKGSTNTKSGKDW